MAPRPNSDAAVTARIALIPRPERETATALRDLIRAALPRAQESIKWGYPTYSGESNICSLNPAKGYVRLQFFRGRISTTPTACWKARARACGTSRSGVART